MGGNWSVSVVTPPSTLPITVEDVKAIARIDLDDEDQVIEDLIPAAVELCETYTGRQIMPATLRLSMDCLPREWFIEFPRPPLRSVSSFVHVTAAGASETWASDNYDVDVYSEPGRLALAWGKSWPSIRQQANGIVITYLAGYASAALVPYSLKHAIKLLVNHWLENREPVNVGAVHEMPFGIASLLDASFARTHP